VLAYRENKKNKNPFKKLPLSDEISFKDLQTDTLCWKEEERRVETLKAAFLLVIEVFFYFIYPLLCLMFANLLFCFVLFCLFRIRVSTR
jgi:hypothetical protein